MYFGQTDFKFRCNRSVQQNLHTTFGQTEMGFGPTENLGFHRNFNSDIPISNSVRPNYVVQWSETKSVSPSFRNRLHRDAFRGNLNLRIFLETRRSEQCIGIISNVE